MANRELEAFLELRQLALSFCSLLPRGVAKIQASSCVGGYVDRTESICALAVLSKPPACDLRQGFCPECSVSIAARPVNFPLHIILELSQNVSSYFSAFEDWVRSAFP